MTTEVLMILSAIVGGAIGYAVTCYFASADLRAANAVSDRSMSTLRNELAVLEDSLRDTNAALMEAHTKRKTAEAAREGMKIDRDKTAKDRDKYKGYWDATYASHKKAIMRRAKKADEG